MKIEERETHDDQADVNRKVTALTETVHSLSAAVTTLADRLNALALRVALMGGTNDRAVDDGEAYLKRLSSLVGAAGDEMRHVQELLQLIEANTRDPTNRTGSRSWHWPGPPHRSDH